MKRDDKTLLFCMMIAFPDIIKNHKCGHYAKNKYLCTNTEYYIKKICSSRR